MRLIDADALPRLTQIYEFNGKRMEKEIVDAKSIDNAPTIDAVPVIRCRDCKHRDPEDKKCDCGHAIQWQLPRDDDWFCADGERKDDE